MVMTQTWVVTERPIIFSGAMVRAILEGRKTQTRRVVKWPNPVPAYLKCASDCKGVLFDKAFPDLLWGVTPGFHVPCVDGAAQRYRNPWNWPNDTVRLWVRECYGYDHSKENVKDCLIYRADFPKGAIVTSVKGERAVKNWMGDVEYEETNHWHPSTHMLREDSRITLEITEVRVERLQAITDADAIAEGCEDPTSKYVSIAPGFMREVFKGGWDYLNAKRGFGWDANPWVWVISFKVIQSTT